MAAAHGRLLADTFPSSFVGHVASAMSFPSMGRRSSQASQASQGGAASVRSSGSSMSILNPSARLTMPGQIHKAYKVMLKLINPKFVKADQGIPLKILQNAKGVAFITVIKAGFMWSGTVGTGIVLARLPDGSWSGPSSIGVGGMGWGALIGASITDSVIILNNDFAVAAFSGHGQVSFGGNLSVAAGPIGREADGSAHLGDGGVAACYSYSHSRGLFAGVSLQGAIMVTRDSDNTRFYGHPVTAKEILKGMVDIPDFEDLKRLHDCLNVVRTARTGSGVQGGVGGYSDPALAGYRDSSGVSFQGQSQQQPPGALRNSQQVPSWMQKEMDNNDEDDDKAAQAAAARFGGWQATESEDPFANAFASGVSLSSAPSSSNAGGGSLPPGWVEVPNPQGGPPYYWNEAQNITTWDRPAPAAALQAKASAPPPAPPGPVAMDAPLPAGWVQVTDAQGKPYYWNEALNKTQWERPAPEAMPPRLPPRGNSLSSSASSLAPRPLAPSRPVQPQPAQQQQYDNPFA